MIVTDTPFPASKIKDLPVVALRSRLTYKSKWEPLPHHEFLQIVVDKLLGRGWACGEPLIFLAGGDNKDMAASFDLEVPGRFAGEGFSFSVGLRNSTAQRSPVLVYFGLRWAEGNCGVATREWNLGRHNEHLMVGPRMNSVLRWIDEASRLVIKEERKLWAKKLSDGRAERLLIAAAEDKLISREQIWHVLTGWTKGQANAGRLLWRFAKAVSRSRVLLQMRRTYRFYETLRNL